MKMSGDLNILYCGIDKRFLPAKQLGKKYLFKSDVYLSPLH